jgi:WD40 repeat protein
MTANGETLYFGAGDWTIRRMDLIDGTETILEGHSGIVRSLALSSDESRLLSAADDGTIRVWSVDTGDLKHVLNGHYGSVDAVAVTPDGSTGISGSRDQTIRVWDLKTGVERKVLEGHSGFVKSIVVVPTTGQILSGSTDKTIRYWDINATAQGHSQCGHNGAVEMLTLSSDGKRVISGCHTGGLILWESATQEISEVPQSFVGLLDGHTDRINALQITANGKRAFTGSRDRTLRVWDIEQRTCTQVLRGHNREVLSLDVSNDGQRIISLSRDRTLRLWDAETGQCIRALASKGDHRALSALRLNDAMLVELDVGPEVDIFNKSITKDSKIALSPDGNCVIIGSLGNVSVWDLSSGAMMDQGVGDLEITVISFFPTSTRSVLGSLFGPLLVWDYENEPILLDGHKRSVLDIVTAAGGKTVISGGKDDTIRIWDIDSCKQKAQIKGRFGRADAVVIAPDGHFAYSVYGDTVIAYDLDKAVSIASLSIDHQISTIAVTPAGTHLVLGDQSGHVHHLCLQIQK